MSPLPEPAGTDPAEDKARGPDDPTATVLAPEGPLAPSVPQTQGPPLGSSTRLGIGILAGAAAAGMVGWELGEYPFTGIFPYITGILFGLIVAEIILSVGRRPGRVTAVAAALCTVGGLGLGVWISVSEGIDPIPIGGWVAVVLGALVALIRGGIRTGGRPKLSSQPSS